VAEDVSAAIITIDKCVLVAVRDDLDDASVLRLQDRLMEEIARHEALGVVIDVSALEIVDTFAGRMLGAMAEMSRLLDARTVVVGMRPAVAMTLVELGMTLDGVETALNAERAIALIGHDAGPRSAKARL
jgi:rsbT antagonist protein RsbS